MGYSIYSTQSKFFMKQEHSQKALAAIKQFAREQNDSDTSRVLQARDLISAMEIYNINIAFRWADEGLTQVGDYIGIKIPDSRSYNQKEALQVIAPFVEPESFIEIRGEDGREWRWVFRNEDCVYVEPKKTWD